jgi:hypothetical protein
MAGIRSPKSFCLPASGGVTFCGQKVTEKEQQIEMG